MSVTSRNTTALEQSQAFQCAADPIDGLYFSFLFCERNSVVKLLITLNWKAPETKHCQYTVGHTVTLSVHCRTYCDTVSTL
jgi:hypothetical protein